MKNILRIVISCVFVLLSLGAWAQEDSDAWYDVDRLNAGMGAPSDKIKRATPRSAMRSFIEVSDEGDHASAAHVLNLNDIPEQEQESRGAEIARQLASVIERRVWVDWSDLPSRPDAKVEGGTSNNPQAGQVRRDLGIKLIEIDGRAYEIRIARYKHGESDAIWLFTPQTVEDVPKLYDAFGPRAFEHYIPESMKQKLGGLRIWEWLALPLLLCFLLGLGWLVNRLVGAFARKATHYAFLHQAFKRASTPISLFVVAIAAQVLLSLGVSFSGPVTSVVQPMLVVIMAAAIGIAALRVVDAVLDRVTLRFVGEIDDTRSLEKRELYTSIYALRRIIVLIMVGFAAFYVLARLNLFESFGITLLASAGVLTVLLGIAGQAVLGSILASLQIALAKPVRIGDSIMFEGEWAYVESIFYTYMRLRTWDERRIIVPVRHFVSTPFENWSVKDARIMRTIRLILDHSADIGVMRERFEAIAKEEEGVIEPDQLTCYVTAHSEKGQEITFYAMTPDPSTGWVTEMRLREQLLSFVREEHPDWWPRERFADLPDGAVTAGD